MDSFFKWLSNSGPFEEILMVIILIILLVFIYFIIKRVKVDCKGIKINSDEPTNSNARNRTEDNSNVEENQKHESLPSNSNNISLIATQDYRIISLIAQAHASRIREEMKQYCSINGLDKKSTDSYMLYVDEKKNLYVSEMKEMFNREYVSYDILSITDIYEIIEEIKEQMMNKLEKLYIKLRDISIEEHGKINEQKNNEMIAYLTKVSEWHKSEFKNEKDRRNALEEIVRHYRDICEKITVNERIDILNKQLQKIDTSRRDLVDIFLTSVVNKMNTKMHS